jgi:hypothetical protein
MQQVIYHNIYKFIGGYYTYWCQYSSPPVIRTITPTTTPLVTSDLRCTEIAKYYNLSPWREANPLIRVTLSLIKMWPYTWTTVQDLHACCFIGKSYNLLVELIYLILYATYIKEEKCWKVYQFETCTCFILNRDFYIIMN